MDNDWLTRQVAVRARVSNPVLPAGLLLCLLSALLAVDDEHVNAKDQAAPADDATYDNRNVNAASRVIATVAVTIPVTGVPARRTSRA